MQAYDDSKRTRLGYTGIAMQSIFYNNASTCTLNLNKSVKNGQ